MMGCARWIHSLLNSAGSWDGGLHQKSPGFGAGAVNITTAMNHDVGILHRNTMSMVRNCHLPKWPSASPMMSVETAMIAALDDVYRRMAQIELIWSWDSATLYLSAFEFVLGSLASFYDFTNFCSLFAYLTVGRCEHNDAVLSRYLRNRATLTNTNSKFNYVYHLQIKNIFI